MSGALLVGVGGLAGVLARYGLTLWVESIWTVVGINIVGSFLLGVLVHTGIDLSNDVRNALSIGVLGGFTTFSTVTVQTIMEADGGRPRVAVAYLLATLVGGLLAAIAGYMLGKAIA